ncbi:unnamed protein product [Prunus brigantina]
MISPFHYLGKENCPGPCRSEHELGSCLVWMRAEPTSDLGLPCDLGV